MRDVVLADGVASLVATVLDNVKQDGSAMKNVSWCLANMLKGERQAPIELIAPSIPALARAIMRTENDSVVNDIVWGFSYFTQNGSNDRLACIV